MSADVASTDEVYAYHRGLPDVPTRHATVTGARSEREVAAYLPSCYRVTGSTTDPGGRLQVHIAGVDYAGWTLDDYVIPRLASGCLWAHEDLS